ncbi:MAG: RnfABCDGE type electron transport complex subunit B [Candidatus Berkiellales bacterium]
MTRSVKDGLLRHGEPPNDGTQTYQVAIIDESTCIGCTKCIQVCPVEAIHGANKQLHSVLTEFCIGCKLCLPPCPVDCITLENVSMIKQERHQQAAIAKQRYQAKKQRLMQTEQQKQQKDQQTIQEPPEDLIAAAIQRARQKRQGIAGEISKRDPSLRSGSELSSQKLSSLRAKDAV